MTQIAILDDQKTILEGFKTFFSDKNTSGFHCVLTATTNQYLWQKLIDSDVSNLRFLLIDILLADESGLDAVAKIHRRWPHIELIMFSATEDAEALIKAFGSGASGYLLKNLSFEQVAANLTVAMNGGAAISTEMARKLIAYFKPRDFERGKLKPRTLQVLHFLAEGWSYKMIANNMGITIDGVRFHIKEIYSMLNIQSKAQAVRKYLDGDY